MSTMLKFQYFLLLWIIPVLLSAQSGVDTRLAVVHSDTAKVKATIFIKSGSLIQYDNSRYYYCYYKGQIHRLQGSHTGHLLHGPYLHFNRKDKLLEKGQFKEGLQYGLWKSWYEDGTLKAINNYDDGLLYGDFERYDSTGQLLKKGTFKKGKLDGKLYVYEDGQLSEVIKYDDGEIKNAAPLEKADSTAIATEELTDSTVTTKARFQTTKEEIIEEAATAPSFVTIFIIDEHTQNPVTNASVKVNQINKSSQKESYQRFCNTDQEGKIVLDKVSADYVLYISKKDYTIQQSRIYGNDQRTSHLIKLKKAETCTEISGLLIDGLYNYPVKHVNITARSSGNSEEIRTYSDENGQFKLCLKCGQNYQLQFTATDYEAKSEKLVIHADCSTSLNSPFKVYLAPQQQEVVASSAPPVNSSPTAQSQTAVSVKTNNRTALPFHVIVGTFSSRKNAENRLKEAHQLGYTQARIIQYVDSGYYAVSIGDFAKEQQADQLKKSSKLKAFIKKL